MSKKLIVENRWKQHLKRRHDRELSKRTDRAVIQPSTHSKVEKRRTWKIKAPRVFSLLSNPSGMIRFLDGLESRAKQYHISLDMSDVTEIGADAIATLIATMSRPSFRKSIVRGNLPDCIDCRQLLMGSGFFEHVLFRGDFPEIERSAIYRQSSKRIEPVVADDLIKRGTAAAFGAVGGSEASYSALIEIMNNTLDHANVLRAREIGDKAALIDASRIESDMEEARKTGIPVQFLDNDANKIWKKSKKAKIYDYETWWATVHADTARRRVCFVFLDTGAGIFRSVPLKLAKRLDKLLRNLGDHDLLRDVLQGKLGSRTKLSYRGKGLPKLFELSETAQILDLTILSNHAFGKISKDQYVELETEFRGTLIYWEISSVD